MPTLTTQHIRWSRELAFVALSLAASLAPLSAHADQVIADSLIVTGIADSTGGACIGLDCSTNGSEVIADAELIFKENNTRLVFNNLATTGDTGDDWYVVANDSASGGAQYFSFEADDYGPFALRMYASSNGGVALGLGSQYTAAEAGQVSAGSIAAQRSIRHVASPEASTDALNMSTIQDYSALLQRKAQLLELKALVAQLRARVAVLEALDTDNDGTPNGSDPFPRANTRNSIGGKALSIRPATPSSTCAIISLTPSPTTAANRPQPEVSANELDFTLRGCKTGERVTVELDFDEPFPTRAIAYKVVNGVWTPIPGAVVSGSTVTYSLVDNGPLDTDPADGVIRDPVAVGFNAAAFANAKAVPAGSLVFYSMMAIGLLIAASGKLGIRRRRS